MEKIKMNCDVLRSRCTRALAGPLLAALGVAMFVGPIPVHAEGFPFGHDLLLDTSPMRGSKKVPMLDIGDAGTAEIELWCNSVKAQLVVAGATITIITGETSARQCAPTAPAPTMISLPRSTASPTGEWNAPPWCSPEAAPCASAPRRIEAGATVGWAKRSVPTL
jgi:hypothetical protein